MANIKERNNADGSSSFTVNIRRKGLEISKTFSNKDDAQVYAKYKENLIDNMTNFEVTIEQRVSLQQLMELKLNHDNLTQRTKLDLMHSVQEINSYISDKFISEISYDDWLTVAKSLLDSDVYKGAKTENGKRKMSIVTLLRRFGYISSIISYAQQQNIPIDNLPLKIIQTFIRPLMDKK